MSAPRLGQSLKYDIYLECHVEAYPLPEIIWLKDGVQLANNQHISISHIVNGAEITDSIIRVIATDDKRQYGSYTCKAVNKLGIGEVNVHLFETISSKCTPACDQLQAINDNAV